ncbi:MAG: KpsF/GutQ family sugar-phosphate isomerase [Chlamydiae bacterium]|nr:KpsF/GutQ family sugar-phosphate isomerase [Chlamydiota bacterium]
MIKNILDDAQQHISHFFRTVDIPSLEHVVERCKGCKGLIILTGVGKSGIIAEKIAMTLISTGTRALYLPAMNFLHGDIGIVSDQDIVLMISKTGESDELLNLIPFIQRKKATLIAVVSKLSNRLSQVCDFSVYLPVEKELCSFDLVPTTSTVVQLIFGDILAVALMKYRDFQLSHYAMNHPAGAIGKKLTLSIRDLMLAGDHIPLCDPQDKLMDVLVELSNKRCGALLIANQHKAFLGIFTDGDLRRALQSKGSSVLGQSMESLMSPSAFFLDPDVLAWDALKYMQQDPSKWVMVLPVLDGAKIIGILRMHDLVQAGIS